MQTYKRLASGRSCAGLIGPGLVENPEDDAQCDQSHLFAVYWFPLWVSCTSLCKHRFITYSNHSSGWGHGGGRGGLNVNTGQIFALDSVVIQTLLA